MNLYHKVFLKLPYALIFDYHPLILEGRVLYRRKATEDLLIEYERNWFAAT